MFIDIFNKHKLSDKMCDYLRDNVKEIGIVKIIEDYAFNVEKIEKEFIYNLFYGFSKNNIKKIITINNLYYKYFNNDKKSVICNELKNVCNLIDYKYKNNYINLTIMCQYIHVIKLNIECDLKRKITIFWIHVNKYNHYTFLKEYKNITIFNDIIKFLIKLKSKS